MGQIGTRLKLKRVTIIWMPDHKTIIDLDPWLRPFEGVINYRNQYINDKKQKLLEGQSLIDFSLGHLYFGLHRNDKSWTFREWAPNAKRIFLVGDFNDWKDASDYELTKKAHGEWEIVLPSSALKHLQHYKLHVYWTGGDGYRIPSYATYVVQDKETHVFDAVVWSPAKPYKWTDDDFKPSEEPPLIYEAHVGMSSDKPIVSSYKAFADKVLPRIKKAGYNTVQLMAVQEHPYYGSFGYHVSNFFAASSRFGTPDDLKHLVDTAHNMGIAVILDLVHSHSVKNEVEGLSRFDGTYTQYFHYGAKGEHTAWDSRCFDYGKNEVLHFLLSNCRFWLDEYRFDGFRFDGITSMLYTHHGLEKSYTSYDNYFGEDVDKDALAYLTMANELIHAVKPHAITVAEDMSALPGLAAPTSIGGNGFDYRLSMGVPDLWIKTIKEKRDEDWDLQTLFHELTAHRAEEKVISYAESHDQALVGDKTIIFRLIDKEMYYHMSIGDHDLVVDRGIALHKMIRLITAATNGGGYLNFMGNEFGHPEWIDFPREGNDWSYHYARRQWKLVDNPKLKYQWLANFDKAMIGIIRLLDSPYFNFVNVQGSDKVISFERSGFVFVFNFSPDRSYTDYCIPAPEGNYKVALSSDDSNFGGQNRVSSKITYSTTNDKNDKLRLMAYLPARTSLVFSKVN